MKNKWQNIVNECIENIDKKAITAIFNEKNIAGKFSELNSWNDLLEFHCLVQGLRNNKKFKKYNDVLKELNHNFYRNKKVLKIARQTKTNIEESIYYWE